MVPSPVSGTGLKRSSFQAGFDAVAQLAKRVLLWHEAPFQSTSVDGSIERSPKIFLVVGECGDGKSTLINALRDPHRSGEPQAGLASRGVTKSIEAYVGKPINGLQVDYLDTPGVGDMDVTPMKVLAMIEQELVTDEINGSDAIDGVIVTTPVPDGRVKLGAQVVQLLVEHGFLGEDKWQNIILVGTKRDRATAEELELFRTDSLDEEGQPMGIAAQFFALAPNGKGTFVTTTKDDYSQLRRAIAELPDIKVRYSSPDTAEMAAVLSEKLGVSKEVFQKELEESRRELEKRLNEQREHSDRLRAEAEDLRAQVEDLQGQDEERQRKQEELQQHLRRLEEQSRQLPSEKEALEKEKERLRQEMEQHRKHNEEMHRIRLQDLQNRESEVQAMMEQATRRARNYNLASVNNLKELEVKFQQQCQHLNRRRWANGSGSGVKCVDCRKSL